MVKVFGVEDRRAKAFGCREESRVVIFELVPSSHTKTCCNIGLIDRHERELPEKRQPLIDLHIVEQLLAPGNVGEFGKALSRHAEERAEHKLDRNVKPARITIPLRSRVEEDVRVEKAFDLLVRHSFHRGSM